MTKTETIPTPPQPADAPDGTRTVANKAAPSLEAPLKPEHGGPKGLEPTRYGDWERNGRCFDF